MLTRVTKVKLVAFLLVAIVVMGYTAVHYANLGRYFGFRGYYVVRLDLANSGGIFPNADVTYRGVSVGRVGAMHLTASGIQVELNISNSAPPIPAHLQASVADLSAVGEEYVDLRPQASTGTVLTNGSVIPQRETQLPLPVTTLLTNINTLAASIPQASLRNLMDALATGFGGQTGNLQSLVDSNSALFKAENSAVPQTTTLITDGQSVLATQVAESSALNSFGQNGMLLARQLAKSNGSLRKLITATPQAATQVSGLITDNNPTLGALIANLLTTSEVSLTRGPALQELLSALPAGVAIGSTVITTKGARVGVALTFFNPLPCTTGYGGTVYRNGLDTSPGRPLNTSAKCAKPASSGVDVRGSANSPSPGSVPAAAQPGLAHLLGLNP
ncbi:MAG TPA: MlaD family protein [Streptosporangiaceae bacterium]|nr:MlaD family protein [Streptosporangiaceae bacterium]